MSLPSDFFKVQHLVGKRIIRRNETTDINGANVFNGRIFVLRNEAWEPHLNHAASIAGIFSINLEFEYSIKKFDKIVEYNEFYVIKFISESTIEAKSIIDQFRNVELDEKYNNKEKR